MNPTCKDSTFSAHLRRLLAGLERLSSHSISGKEGRWKGEEVEGMLFTPPEPDNSVSPTFSCSEVGEELRTSRLLLLPHLQLLVVRRWRRRAELRSNNERCRSTGALAPAFEKNSEGEGAGRGDSEPTTRY